MARSLGASASRGAAVTLVGQVVRIIIQLAGIVVLARLLSPSAYGLLAMVTAIIGVGDILRDFGLSSAAIQARTLLPKQKSNLFWLNLGIGGVLAVAVFLCSWPIAALYGDPRLQPLAAVLSVTFLLNGAATQFRADLTRSMRFGRLSIADIAGQGVGLVLAILAASAGLGYWALAVQQVAAVVVQVLVVVAVTGWLPGLPSRHVPMRSFLSFGLNLAGVQTLTYASRNVDSLVLGTTVGASVLGLYNRAFQLMALPLNQLNAPLARVALPVLSRLQDDGERYSAFLRRGQTVLLNLAGAIIAFCAAQATAILLIALGPAWTGAIPIFQILAFAGFFTALNDANWWVFLSKGLPKANLQMSLITRPLVIGLILIGSLWGAFGVAAGYSVGCALLWPIALWFLHRKSDAPVRMMLGNGLRTFFVFAFAGTASWLSTFGYAAATPWLALVIGGVTFIAALALVALIVPVYRRDVQDIFRLRKYFGRSRAAAPEPVAADVSTV